MSNQLTNLGLSNGITRINASAFRDNRLRTLLMPDSINDVRASAFRDNLIDNLRLSENLHQFPTSMFDNNRLKEIHLSNSVTSLGDYVFRNNKIEQGNATIDNDVESVSEGVGVLNNNIGENLFFLYLRDKTKTNQLVSFSFSVTSNSHISYIDPYFMI